MDMCPFDSSIDKKGNKGFQSGFGLLAKVEDPFKNCKMDLNLPKALQLMLELRMDQETLTCSFFFTYPIAGNLLRGSNSVTQARTLDIIWIGTGNKARECHSEPWYSHS